MISEVLGFYETKREPFMAIVYFFSDESGKQKKNRGAVVISSSSCISYKSFCPVVLPNS